MDDSDILHAWLHQMPLQVYANIKLGIERVQACIR